MNILYAYFIFRSNLKCFKLWLSGLILTLFFGIFLRTSVIAFFNLVHCEIQFLLSISELKFEFFKLFVSQFHISRTLCIPPCTKFGKKIGLLLYNTIKTSIICFNFPHFQLMSLCLDVRIASVVGRPSKKSPRYNWNIVASGVKCHNPNPGVMLIVLVSSAIHCGFEHPPVGLNQSIHLVFTASPLNGQL